MANYIEYTDINPLHYVPGSSRYVDSVVLKYTENNFLTFETYKRKPQPVNPKKDKYWVITKGYEYRPDMASFQFYGVADFWWRLLEANGMMDIMEFKAGVNIRVPGDIFY